jgi:molybdopterin synthase catalytic subunit
MAYAFIGAEPIDTTSLEKRVVTVEDGAVCTFVGNVRRHSRGREVAYLEYNAYLPIASRTLQEIADEAEQRWQVKLAVQHRTGRVDLGEASVVIVVTSVHRAEAFEACRFCIDTLKENVPIWKREVCPDGAFWIEGEEVLPASKAD